MSNENFTPRDELPQQHSSFGFTAVLIVVAILAVVFAVFMGKNNPRDGEHGDSQQLNQQFPPLEGVGWINGPGPTAEELKSKVMIVDAWAFWCGPCRMTIPSLLEIHEKYKDRGVIVVGMTAEGFDPKSLKLSNDFVSKLQIPWPNVYGAIRPMQTLDVNQIPQLWVVDRNNNIVFHEIGWSTDSPSHIEDAIEKALKATTGQSSEEK